MPAGVRWPSGFTPITLAEEVGADQWTAFSSMAVGLPWALADAGHRGAACALSTTRIMVFDSAFADRDYTLRGQRGQIAVAVAHGLCGSRDREKPPRTATPRPDPTDTMPHSVRVRDGPATFGPHVGG